MVFHNRKPSLSELEEEQERNEIEIDVLRQRQMMEELNKKGGQGFWKRFSSDGTKNGINWRSVWDWLKAH